MTETAVGPVRVVIVDDHELTRNGMVAELAKDGRIEVVGDFGSIRTVPVPATDPSAHRRGRGRPVVPP